MKLTRKQLIKIISEEISTVMEQAEEPTEAVVWDFPTDVPSIDYEEAKDDSEAGILPQLFAANNQKPVFFNTKNRDEEMPSVYTGQKPSSKDAGRYDKMGIRLVWARNSRGDITNFRPRDIIGLARHAKQMRRDGDKYDNYNYMPENIDEMIDEEIKNIEGK